MVWAGSGRVVRVTVFIVMRKSGFDWKHLLDCFWR